MKLQMIKPLLCQDCSEVPTFMYQSLRFIAQAEKLDLVLMEKNFPRKRAVLWHDEFSWGGGGDEFISLKLEFSSIY